MVYGYIMIYQCQQGQYESSTSIAVSISLSYIIYIYDNIYIYHIYVFKYLDSLCRLYRYLNKYKYRYRHRLYNLLYKSVRFGVNPRPPEDYEKLPAGTVEAHKVSEAGEERYVLDAIIGEATATGSG